MYYKITFISLISLIYLFILPVNFILSAKSYGIYNLIAVVSILFLWITPIVYFYNNKRLTYRNISIIIFLNIIVCSIILFFGEKHSEKLQKELIEKVKMIQQYMDEGKIKVK